MASGVPAITTKYSGQEEFVNAKNSYLIPFEIVPVFEAVCVLFFTIEFSVEVVATNVLRTLLHQLVDYLFLQSPQLMKRCSFDQ
jgi:hypothetical protein